MELLVARLMPLVTTGQRVIIMRSNRISGNPQPNWATDTGEPEWNGELRDLVCKHRNDEQEIKTDIGENHITHLTVIGDCHLSLADIAPHMTQLQLRNTSAVESLETFTSLKKLELHQIDLSLAWPSLPANSLEELHVFDCKMETLPSCFTPLQRLKVLRITGPSSPSDYMDDMDDMYDMFPYNYRYYGLKIVPEVVTKLTSLEELDLSSNGIDELPDSFIHLQKLKILRITGYSSPSDGLEDMDGVDEVDDVDDMFSFGDIYHGLETVPEVVTKLTSLEELDLSSNEINELPDRYSTAHLNKFINHFFEMN
ncbi:uncharacterized protein [Watersipora subatra]|uniref:uncharacterized protein n=1 Tax=Watersipora subatra TaxID=2589382 RepID=UPI00355B9BF3